MYAQPGSTSSLSVAGDPLAGTALPRADGAGALRYFTRTNASRSTRLRPLVPRTMILTSWLPAEDHVRCHTIRRLWKLEAYVSIVATSVPSTLIFTFPR